MRHIFKEGQLDGPTLLLLHGTGGNEHDLLPIAEMIDPSANVLSVRGNILENGMPRFFKRLKEGIFDLDDLVKQTKNLAEFIDEASEKYQFDRNQVIAIGYSNGANIAGSLLFHYKNVLKGAILHHPMVPIRDVELPDQKQTAVFIGAGKNDPMCPAKESVELEELLANNGADVTVHWERNGHQLTQTEVQAARDWYQKQFN
ncbi:alpha/beta hydrolase [Amphibacillus indicireducens]|uniref:Alpha/beta hydrolase n=1 Tax=Amphibacillus indicireducens TaxID=1076330 RepID=A0ABP7VNX3_9BACI